MQPETGKAYLRSAMTKLGTHTRFEAVVAARACFRNVIEGAGFRSGLGEEVPETARAARRRAS